MGDRGRLEGRGMAGVIAVALGGEAGAMQCVKCIVGQVGAASDLLGLRSSVIAKLPHSNASKRLWPLSAQRHL